MKKFNTVFALTLLFLVSSCVTKKRKDDVSFLKKFYHNTTAEFNGYFNADVIKQESIETLNNQEQENYNKILPVYKYVAAKDPKTVAPELDRAIEKVSVVVSLHRISDWTDDCYLLLGQAQYLKKDYESAEETLEYAEAEFNPEIMARQKAKYAKKYSKKARKSGKKGKKTEEQKEKEKEREETKKEKLKSAKQKKKEREKERKRKNKEIKKKRKAKKKGKKYKGPSSSKPKTTPQTTTPETPKKEETPKPEEDKKKKEDEPKVDDREKAFKREPAYQEIQLWLARTYIEREKYDRAERIFDELNQSSNTYKKVRAELAPAMAHFYLKRKKYEESTPWLEKAIELTKDRQLKARYAYILAQLYQRKDNASQAFAYFEKAKKFSNAYELEFNAELSMAQNEYRTGKSSPEATIKKLERELKDEKNLEYKDQIYFALANVAIETKQTDKAIDYLEKSIEFNAGNMTQKGESFVALADLYYEKESFVEAKDFYDQALTVLGKGDERYDRIQNLSKNLVDIASNIEIINLQDSLLMISNMDDKERKKLAQKLNDEKLAAIAAAKDKSAGGDPRSGGARVPTSQSFTLGNAAGRNPVSTFPFYNERNARDGRRDFDRKWDDRKLADDWRRSNRPGFTELDITTNEEEDYTKDLTDSEIEQLFKDVPKTDEEKTKARSIVQDAMIELGRLYRERISRDDKAVEILEDRLLVEYPKTKHELDAWYYLYLSHTNLNNNPQAQDYKNKITKKYPTTTYSKILTDPSYVQKILDAEKKVDDYYEETYSEFEMGNFQKAYDRSLQADDLYKENPLKPRFALLSAICVGNIRGKEEYIIALKGVIAKHPDTPEQTRAKEILRLLEGRGGSARSTSAAVEEAASKKFKTEDDKLHYMLIVITDKGNVKINDAKSSIAAFNRVNNKLDKLRISNIYLGTDTNRPIMVIRKFASKEKAMLYYNAALSSGDEFIPEGMTFEIYPITQNNYRQILKDKSLDGYATFFEESYLN